MALSPDQAQNIHALWVAKVNLVLLRVRILKMLSLWPCHLLSDSWQPRQQAAAKLRELNTELQSTANGATSGCRMWMLAGQRSEGNLLDFCWVRCFEAVFAGTAVLRFLSSILSCVIVRFSPVLHNSPKFSGSLFLHVGVQSVHFLLCPLKGVTPLEDPLSTVPRKFWPVLGVWWCCHDVPNVCRRSSRVCVLANFRVSSPCSLPRSSCLFSSMSVPPSCSLNPPPFCFHCLHGCTPSQAYDHCQLGSSRHTRIGIIEDKEKEDAEKHSDAHIFKKKQRKFLNAKERQKGHGWKDDIKNTGSSYVGRAGLQQSEVYVPSLRKMLPTDNLLFSN